MANNLSVKVGIELDSTKIKSQLNTTLKALADQKIQLKFDADMTSLKTLQSTIKDINKSMTELSSTVNNVFKNSSSSSLNTTLKESTNAVKQTNSALKDQQGLYSQLKALQNEEFAIKKQLISATGEHRTVLEKNLSTVMQQQDAVRNQLDTQGNLNNMVRESLKLDQDREKKMRELESATAKYADSMNKVKQEALENMQNLNLSTAEAEKFKEKIENIECNNLAQVKSEVSAIEKEMQSASSSLSDFGKSLQDIGNIANQIGDALLTAFALPTAGIGYAITELSSFTYEMSAVEAISGATGESLEQLESIAKEMGMTTMYSATESAEALKYMGMAGWDSSEMMAGLPAVLNLATASGESLATTSDIVTDALTAFKLQASDTAYFTDVLATASARSNTNVSMLGESFKMAGPIAGALGYTIEDTAIALGLMANAGIKAGTSGRALRQIISGLGEGVDLATKSTNAWRIETTNADGTMRDFRSVMLDLREAFADMTDAQKASNAEAIAGEVLPALNLGKSVKTKYINCKRA